MSIKLNGSNSGSIEIDVPADAGLNTAITFPATSGDAVVKATDGSVDLGDVNLDSSGRLLVGTSSALSNIKRFGDSTSPPQQVISNNTSSFEGGLALINYSASSYAPTLTLGLSRSNTKGANTLVLEGSHCGVITFNGNDGTDFEEAARIECQVDGTPGANDMPGRLVFSTTADGASSPTERMRIASDGQIQTTQDNSFQVYRQTGTSATLVFGVYSNVGGTRNLNLRIDADGDVNNTNNSYGAISDIKLKENIVDANSQWDDLKALQVRNYNLKEGQTHTQIGLIAQEAELVSPGLVSESPDVDEEGNDLGTVTKSVNYSVLYMKSVKALQEAMTRIETLEAEVQALKGGAS